LNYNVFAEMVGGSGDPGGKTAEGMILGKAGELGRGRAGVKRALAKRDLFSLAGGWSWCRGGKEGRMGGTECLQRERVTEKRDQPFFEVCFIPRRGNP